MLKENFGKDDHLSKTHMSQMINLKPIRSCRDLQGLRNLYQEVQVDTRGLESLGIGMKLCAS